MGQYMGNASPEWTRRQWINMRADEIIREAGAPKRKLTGEATGMEYGSGNLMDWLFGPGSRRVYYSVEIENPEYDKWVSESQATVAEAYAKAEEEFDARNPLAGIRGQG